MNTERPKIIAAHAKINLSLDVRGRRPDGYHELDTIFQRLALHDSLLLYPAARGISVVCGRAALPTGPKNTVYRAAELIAQEYGVKTGVKILLKKRIPIAAGLGGGSADAAAVIRALPSFWHLPALSAERELALARMVGADVPFCLHGVTARAGGIGDLLDPLPDFSGYEVLLVKPAARLSTARVYAQLALDRVAHPDIPAVVAAIRQQSLTALGRVVGNALEQPALELVPEIAGIKQALLAAGAPVVLMTGSGPTVFAVSDEDGWAYRAGRMLARPGWTIIATKTI
ncbi:MAG: 4-(cytidine 5'-diphospho)-2-C-methyl-D-erythritol kinase [Bacteroidota bacterium]